MKNLTVDDLIDKLLEIKKTHPMAGRLPLLTTEQNSLNTIEYEVKAGTFRSYPDCILLVFNNDYKYENPEEDDEI